MPSLAHGVGREHPWPSLQTHPLRSPRVAPWLPFLVVELRRAWQIHQSAAAEWPPCAAARFLQDILQLVSDVRDPRSRHLLPSQAVAGGEARSSPYRLEFS